MAKKSSPQRARRPATVRARGTEGIRKGSTVRRPVKAAKKAAKKPAARGLRTSKAAAPPRAARPTSAVVPAETAVRVAGDVPAVRGTGRTLSKVASTAAGIAPIRVAAPPRRRLVVLPPRGLRARGEDTSGPGLNLLLSLFSKVNAGNVAIANIGPGNFGLAAAGNTTLRVVDSIAENGAKLIEVTPGQESAIRAALPGLRVVPEVFYEPMSLRLSLASNLQPLASGTTVKVQVRAADDSSPLARVTVVAFTDFVLRQGAEGITNSKGIATLSLPSVPASFERIYAFADRGFWSSLRHAVSTSSPIVVDLPRIVLGDPHALRHYFAEPDLKGGTGVKVGVIDTGSGPHPDLVIAGGFNAVTGENPGNFGDNGDLHGTHVAGIIASRGSAPSGIRGLAPGVDLFSYRVFAKGANASNFDIAKAIDQAREDGCDLINLSLGRPAGFTAPDEPVVRVALEDARNAGMLPIAAAGNDFRHGVSFPAADDLCVAVSALGNSTVLLKGTVSATAEMPPPGTIPAEFIADFSNIGAEVDVTGPGVGVISTVPAGHFAVMDGTSMACPAVTGVTARLLGAKPAILSMPRDAARAVEISNLLLAAAQRRGFPAALEGRGLPT